MTATEITPDWIALDWGTSNLRGWAMSAGGQVLAEARSAQGMTTLERRDYEAAFRALAPWCRAATVPVVACGMVGSRQGWVEADYASVPCPPLAARFARPRTEDPALRVHIVPGLCQSDPWDVMRGEETQIAGFLHLTPGWDGVLCMPGTHTKWVEISAGEVVSFRTFMTGEMFALLSTQSVLRHSVAADDGPGHQGAQASETTQAFDSALSEAISRPEALAARLFSLRAESLLSEADPQAARARLSGLLIGAELAAARPYWLGRQIAVIGSGTLARAYVRALEAQGAPAGVSDADTVTRAGLIAAHALLPAT